MKITCNEVLDLMVDYIEGDLDNNLQKAIKEHLEECTSCALEYRETKVLISETQNINTPSNEYFDKLTNTIMESIEDQEEKICDATQETLLLFEPLSPQMKKHIKTCTDCQHLADELGVLQNLLSDISVEMPKKEFFKSQVSRIAWRIEYEEKARTFSVSKFIKSVVSSFEYFIRPTSVLLVSGTLAILLVINVFFTDQTPQQQKVLYLSELLRQTKIESSSNKIIPNPTYEQKLNIEATGTASNKDKGKKQI